MPAPSQTPIALRFLIGICSFTAWITCTCLFADERIVLVAGGNRDAVDVPASEARLFEPFGAEFDPSGNLWIIEMASGNRLLKVDENGLLSHVAGVFHSTSAGTPKRVEGDGGPGLDAFFNGPHNLAIAFDGRILIGDTWNGRIRSLDPVGLVLSSLSEYEVSIENAKGSGPYCVSLDPSRKQLYIADLNRILKLDLVTGVKSFVAGNGKKGVPVDGSSSLEAPLFDPRGVAVDGNGNVYILERGGNALRVVSRDGRIKTVVNASGRKGLSQSKGPAIEAMLNGPKHLCIDQLNRVIIADAENHVIVRYDPQSETVERLAGTGKSGSDGLGRSPLACQLARPHGVSTDPRTGELYITDSYNHRILRIADK